MRAPALASLAAAAALAVPGAQGVPGVEDAAKPARPAPKVRTLLMFEGRAEEAMDLYVSLFDGSRIERLERYGAGEPGAEGSVKHASFVLAGQELLCIDSAFDHDFTFTPATSLFVSCESREELDALFAELSKDGEVFMPPGDYGFSRRFTWLSDRFGVSWQLDLPDA